MGGGAGGLDAGALACRGELPITTAATPSIIGLGSCATTFADEVISVLAALLSAGSVGVTFSPRALVVRVGSIRDSSPDFFPRFATGRIMTARNGLWQRCAFFHIVQ